MSNLKNVEPYWKVDDAGLSHVIKEEGKEYEADIVIPADVLKEAFAKFGPKYMKREELDDAADIEKVQPVLMCRRTRRSPISRSPPAAPRKI